jgi:cytochrome c nitrite reductase small subunit
MRKRWIIATVIMSGIAIGLGGLAMVMSQATSYMSDRPEVCVNCHIMRPQYATWKASAHHTVATCNDCHVPHDTVINKYRFKAEDGLRHSAMFTLHLEPQVIRIREAGMNVVQQNCLRCHGQIVDASAMGKLSFTRQDNARPASAQPLWQVVNGLTVASTATQSVPLVPAPHGDPARLCIDCHRETPHGRVSSLSSAPEARIERLQALGGDNCPVPLGQRLLDESPHPTAPAAKATP